MNVAIIPARGGSKRIPRKNIREFCGQPMIAWPIRTALQSKLFDRVIVSTEDEEIAEAAQASGAEAPFTRPAELADDHAGTTAVMAHAVQWLVDHGAVQRGALACCIYATAPFVTAHDLEDDPSLSYAISVTSFPFPIQRSVRMDPEGRLAMRYPEYRDTRSQDLEEAYHDAAQFYWGRLEAWRTENPLFDTDSAGVPIPRARVQDIDTLEDWERAELIFQTLFGKQRPSC